MKNKLLCFVLASLMFVSVNSYAGFRIKRSPENMTVTTATAGNMPERKALKREQRREEVKAIKRLTGESPHKGRHSKSGWEGIVALVCGILGVFTGYLLIPAIIFGAIGMGKGHVHRGMALAGFIIGVAVIAIALIIIALLFAFGGGIM